MDKSAPAPCMVDGCEKPGTLRCPICKAEGTLFKVCSQDCLNKIWNTHKLFHKAYSKDTTESKCRAPGCDKPGLKRCPVCKGNGVVFKICSQTCLDKIWNEHKTTHKETVCMVQGCSKPGVKRCPMCKDNGVVFKVCSQDCLDKIWPEHKKTHKEAQCMVAGCTNPGVKRCPVCKQSGQVFKICSQSCLDSVWAEHKLTHKDAQCMVPGCQKPGLKRCPMCKHNGKVFRICSQACLDEVWPTHKKVHRKQAADGSGRIASEVEFTAYLGVVRMAIADDVLTVEKERMLAEHRKAFHVSHVQHLKVLQTLGLTEDRLEDMKEANKQAPTAANASSKQTECVICCDEEANHIVLDCMHICVCEGCAEHYKEKIAVGETESCPICRNPVREIRKTFKN